MNGEGSLRLRCRGIAQQTPADHPAGDNGTDLARRGRNREGEDRRADSDRGALAALPSRPLARAHAEPLAGATEHALAEIWCAVLGVASACASDDFFALGGHSLRALQLAAAVRERFGVDMPALAARFSAV